MSGNLSWTDIERERLVSDPDRSERVARLAAEFARMCERTDPVGLSALRLAFGIRQADIADRMGSSQANVSRVELEDDLLLSTLRRYVEALGGRLELAARFLEGQIPFVVVGDRRGELQREAALRAQGVHVQRAYPRDELWVATAELPDGSRHEEWDLTPGEASHRLLAWVERWVTGPRSPATT